MRLSHFTDIDLSQLLRDLVKTRRNSPRITWALGPSSPERCSEKLLSSLAEFSPDEKLPVYTHIYELKAMTLIARQTHAKDEGSLINYLDRVGLLTRKVDPCAQRLDGPDRNRASSNQAQMLSSIPLGT